jgi:hypothetical protein
LRDFRRIAQNLRLAMRRIPELQRLGRSGSQSQPYSMSSTFGATFGARRRYLSTRLGLPDRSRTPYVAQRNSNVMRSVKPLGKSLLPASNSWLKCGVV